MCEIDWVDPAVDEVILAMIKENKLGREIIKIAVCGRASEDVKRELITWFIEKKLLLMYVGKKRGWALRSYWVNPRCIDRFLLTCCCHRQQSYVARKMDDWFLMGRTSIGTLISIVPTKEFIEIVHYDHVLFLFLSFFVCWYIIRV